MIVSVLVGCGGSGTAPSVQLVSIGLTPTNPTVAAGLTDQFTATGNYSDGSTLDISASVTWNSSSPSVATVGSGPGAAGLASALVRGSTVLTARSNGVSGSTTLTVTAAALVSIAVTPEHQDIPVGSAQQFTATGTYTDHSTPALTSAVIWRSSNLGVANISNAAGSQGLATAVSTGTTAIGATLGGIASPTATLDVVAQSLQVSAAPIPNQDGTIDVTLTATITPWSDNSSGMLRFADNGLDFQAAAAPAVSAGVVTITIPNVYPGAHAFAVTYTGNNSATSTTIVSGTYGAVIIPVPPVGSAYVGASAVNKNGGTGPTSIAALESAIGRKVVFHLEYPSFSNNTAQLWTDPANDVWSKQIADDFANGRIPMVSWGCIDSGSTIDQITAGAKDAYLHAMSAALIAMSGSAPANRVMLRWCWEMNLPVNAAYYAAGSNEAGRATEFIAAWQHIVTLIRADFASSATNPNHYPLNVAFLFNPGASKVNGTLSPVGDLYYPGARCVDWIGLDDYDDNSVTDFSTLNGWLAVSPPAKTPVSPGFYPLYTNGTASGVPLYPAAGYDKPLLIGETGAPYLCGGTCSASSTDTQAQYLFSTAAEVLARFPQVRGVNYFSSSGPNNAWELDGTLASGGGLAAYQSLACSVAFGFAPTGASLSCP